MVIVCTCGTETDEHAKGCPMLFDLPLSVTISNGSPGWAYVQGFGWIEKFTSYAATGAYQKTHKYCGTQVD